MNIYKRVIRKVIFTLPHQMCEKLIDILSKRKHYPTVFMFHSVKESAEGQLYIVSQDYFNRVVSYLAERGYTFLFENEYERNAGKTIILSFDDGFSNNYLYAYPICRQTNAKMSVNLISDKIDNSADYLSVKQIEEMKDSGLVQFQSHTRSHPTLTECDDRQLADEIINSKNVIKEKTGIDCDCFVYPRGMSNAKATELAYSTYKFAFGGDDYSKKYRLMHIHREELIMGEDERSLSHRILFNLICFN